MKRIVIVFIWACVLACSPRPTTYYAGLSRGFEFLNSNDTINLTVDKFVKNDAYCFTEGIPYALIIGTVENERLPKKISVLAQCDNSTYDIGQKLKILAIENPTIKTTLKPIYFVKDSLVGGQRYKFLIGSEYPGIWGKVLK